MVNESSDDSIHSETTDHDHVCDETDNEDNVSIGAETISSSGGYHHDEYHHQLTNDSAESEDNTAVDRFLTECTIPASSGSEREDEIDGDQEQYNTSSSYDDDSNGEDCLDSPLEDPTMERGSAESEYDCPPLLYDGSIINTSTSWYSIMYFAVSNKLSYKAIEDLIKLMKVC